MTHKYKVKGSFSWSSDMIRASYYLMQIPNVDITSIKTKFDYLHRLKFKGEFTDQQIKELIAELTEYNFRVDKIKKCLFYKGRN